MKKSEFFKPASLKEAVELLDKYKENAVIINGGSDIAGRLGKCEINPDAIIFVADLPELKKIEEKDGKIAIGGSVTYVEMLANPLIRDIRGMMEAVSQLGSPPVRRVGTAAGNLVNAAPAADCATMLVAMGAEVVLASVNGERTVSTAEWYLGRGKTVCQPNEIVKEILVKKPGKGDGTGYIRLARRKSQDIAKVLIGVTVHVEGGKATSCICGFGALAATIIRAPHVEEAVVGKTKEEAMAWARATFPVDAKLRPSRFTHYKELVLQPALERAIEMAFNDAEV
ncbi:MAG: FAD binding domain-containing protein [Firmicutes bacterium]|nr:FAD binding domain-containing protein [Bacillota bacterium]